MVRLQEPEEQEEGRGRQEKGLWAGGERELRLLHQQFPGEELIGKEG